MLEFLQWHLSLMRVCVNFLQMEVFATSHLLEWDERQKIHLHFNYVDEINGRLHYFVF